MGETSKTKEIEVKVKTVERKGKYPTIVIPRSIFEYAKIIFETDLFKLYIINDEKYTYYWKYKREREQEITFRNLKHGEYKVKIEPYFLSNFLREFNGKIKFPISLSLEKGVLIAKCNNVFVSTKQWTYEKERGCGVVILAKYPSKTRIGYEVSVKFQMKMGEANLWIVEPRHGSRPAVYKIEEIEAHPNSIDLYYRHGRKLKKTAIKIMDITTFDDYKPEPTAIKLLSIQNTFISGQHVIRYQFSISDERIFRNIESLIKESYKDLKEEKIEDFVNKRDEIGKRIAIHFLSTHGLEKFIVEPAKNKRYEKVFKQMLGNKRPDIIGFKGKTMYLIEAKFRFYENDGRKALKPAIFQINQYLSMMKKESLEEYLNREIQEIRKIVLITGFDHRINQGYIIYWRD